MQCGAAGESLDAYWLDATHLFLLSLQFHPCPGDPRRRRGDTRVCHCPGMGVHRALQLCPSRIPICRGLCFGGRLPWCASPEVDGLETHSGQGFSKYRGSGVGSGQENALSEKLPRSGETPDIIAEGRKSPCLHRQAQEFSPDVGSLWDRNVYPMVEIKLPQIV
jgi:hypothetical protein